MKNILLFPIIILFTATSVFAQVGIGTTNPNPNALLDVDATTTKGGLLMPRIALVATTNALPLVNHVAGMTLYNTATVAGTNGVSPGYYYNNGIKWIRLSTEEDSSNSWTTSGNVGTDPATHFVGTTDNNALRIKTNNTDRFEVNATLRSFSNGTQGAPSYSWQNATNYGMYYSNNGLNFSTGGSARIRIPNANQVHAMQSGTSALPFYSWENDVGTGMFRESTNTLGFSAGGGQKFWMNANGQLLATDWVSGTSPQTPSFSWALYPTTGLFMPAANAIGFSTSQLERMRINSSGRIIINAGSPSNNSRVTVRDTDNRGIWARSETSEGIRGESNSEDAIVGLSTTGRGVYGQASNSNGTGGYFRNTAEGGIGLMVSGNGGPIRSFGNSGEGGAFTGHRRGSVHFATQPTGSGVLGIGNNLTTFTGVPNGAGVMGVGSSFGVSGYSLLESSNSIGFGGHFTSDDAGLAAVGGWGGLTTRTRYKVFGNGVVSTIVKDLNEKDVIMYAPESPEVLFQDYGSATLRNGIAQISLDPIFSKNISVNQKHPIRVFIQLEGNCNGVYVTDKSGTGFTVIELQEGKSNADFSWQVVATRANEKIIGSDGQIKVSDHSLRFPPVPLEFFQLHTEKISSDAIEPSKREEKSK